MSINPSGFESGDTGDTQEKKVIEGLVFLFAIVLWPYFEGDHIRTISLRVIEGCRRYLQ